jgi:regulator of nonsense transcripts 2
MQPQTEVQDNGETSVSEHQTDRKVNEEANNRENTEIERLDKEKNKKKVSKKGDAEREKVRGIDGASLDSLLQKLPRCGSRDLIDRLTVRRVAMFFLLFLYIWVSYSVRAPFINSFSFLQVEFCYLNSKVNRKKLVRALFSVPRTSLELLPYYSRLVATLSPFMKDLPSMLLSMLEEEFDFLINKKVCSY